MVPIIAGVLLAARVPEAQAALAVVRGGSADARTVAAPPAARPSGHALAAPSRTLIRGIRPRHAASAPGDGPAGAPGRRCRGLEAERTSGDRRPAGAPTGPRRLRDHRIAAPSADDFQPDVPRRLAHAVRADEPAAIADARRPPAVPVRPAAVGLRRRSDPRIAGFRRAPRTARSRPRPPTRTST